MYSLSKCFGKFYVTKVRLNYILNKLIYIPLWIYKGFEHFRQDNDKQYIKYIRPEKETLTVISSFLLFAIVRPSHSIKMCSDFNTKSHVILRSIFTKKPRHVNNLGNYKIFKRTFKVHSVTWNDHIVFSLLI